jgi:hypothetical protein
VETIRQGAHGAIAALFVEAQRMVQQPRFIEL